MKLYKIIFPATLTIFLIATGLVYCQDKVIPAETDDIEAFDKALMKQKEQFEKKNADIKNSTDAKSKYANSKQDEIGEEISKEAQKMKDMDAKTKKKIQGKIQENAHADAKNVSPKGSTNPADVIPPSKSAVMLSQPTAPTHESTPKGPNK